MTHRYTCTLCEGTFDVADREPAPVCNVGQIGARVARMQHTGGSMFARFRGDPTNCRHLSGHALKADFLRQDKRIRKFVPSTHYGNFDCTYNPRAGVLLIELNIHINYRLDPGKAGEVLPDWLDSERTAFENQCKQAVLDHWTGKAEFVCTKPGWTDLRAKPWFELRFLSRRSDANYNIDVFKDRQKFSHGNQLAPKCNGALVPSQLTTDNIDAVVTGTFQSFHAETFPIALKASGPITSERERLSDALRDVLEGRVAFNDASAVLTGGSNAALLDFLGICQQRLPSTPALPFVLKPVGPCPERLLQQRLQAVAARLRSIGHRVTVSPGSSIDDSILAPPSVDRRQRSSSVSLESRPRMNFSVEITLDEEFGGLGTIVEDVADYQYNVFAHEFGHMLGLPDEYINDEGRGAKARLQRNFLALCGAAGVRPPVFPSHTSSLMSEGIDIQVCHFLTLWNSLCALTRGSIAPNQWDIVLVG